MIRRIRGAVAPPPGAVGPRKAIDAASLEELASEASKLARPGSAAEVALNDLLAADDQISIEEQVGRAADALLRAYLPQSWARVLQAARTLENVSSRRDFATAVREEIERRHKQSTSDI